MRIRSPMAGADVRAWIPASNNPENVETDQQPIQVHDPHPAATGLPLTATTLGICRRSARVQRNPSSWNSLADRQAWSWFCGLSVRSVRPTRVSYLVGPKATFASFPG